MTSRHPLTCNVMTCSVSHMDNEMTVAEVANELRVTERTVRRWIADGTLPATKIVGRVRINRADVEALAQKAGTK